MCACLHARIRRATRGEKRFRTRSSHNGPRAGGKVMLSRIRHGRQVLLAGAALAAALIGGCESSTAYKVAQSFNVNARLAYDDRTLNHVGGEVQAHATAEPWTAQRTYEYLGGRDPVTGRATTQM
jgi:hypothetical protein